MTIALSANFPDLRTWWLTHKSFPAHQARSLALCQGSFPHVWHSLRSRCAWRVLDLQLRLCWEAVCALLLVAFLTWSLRRCCGQEPILEDPSCLWGLGLGLGISVLCQCPLRLSPVDRWLKRLISAPSRAAWPWWARWNVLGLLGAMGILLPAGAGRPQLLVLCLPGLLPIPRAPWD